MRPPLVRRGLVVGVSAEQGHVAFVWAAPDRLAALVDEMQALVGESSLAHGQTACQWFGGWAQARKGQPRKGHRLIREAYEHNTRLGMRAGASEVLGYAAEALLLVGDVEDAQAQLKEALQIADELDEGV